MRVRNISKIVLLLYYVKIHRKHIGKTIVVHNLEEKAQLRPEVGGFAAYVLIKNNIRTTFVCGSLVVDLVVVVVVVVVVLVVLVVVPVLAVVVDLISKS